ncbi:MAG TPA: DUF6265 family protein [Lacunisphaera sp.]|jgi:hypothetical protein
MKSSLKFTVFICALAPAVFFPLTAMGAPKKKAPPPLAIAKLAWLAGSWRLEKNSQVVDEQWMVPGGGVMLGVERTVEKGKVREFAFLQIREGPGGGLFFVQQVSGQKEAAFQSKTLTDTAVVFLNQLQDFPRTISYALQSDGSVIAIEEGTGADGQPKWIETVYRRNGQ